MANDAGWKRWVLQLLGEVEEMRRERDGVRRLLEEERRRVAELEAALERVVRRRRRRAA